MISVRIKKQFGVNSVGDSRGAAGGFMLDAEFEAPPGITILFGASGSGKSTTIKSIAGLIRPDSGVISVDGRALFDSQRRVNVPIRDRRVGLVFQSLALFPHLSSLNNVEFPIADLPKQERRKAALDIMERLGIRHTAARRPCDISGGEAQRVALARALASKPQLLLLDEPLSAIDEATKQGIIADLKMINRDLRLPMIYVTHSRDESVSLGDHLVAYERGRVVTSGEPLEVFEGPVMAGVARLTGVENVFEGVVVERSPSAGTMTVMMSDGSGSCYLDIPLGRQGKGDPVRVAIRSGDILVATEDLRSTSARNILYGSVTAIEERGDYSIVRVKSGVTWAASITRQAAGELSLSKGQNIWLAIKTHSCHLLDSRG